MITDEGPTEQGYTWYCNGCPYQTPSHDEAVAHAVTMKTGVFPHLLYERSQPATADGRQANGARRRVATYASGVVQTEVAPPKAAKK